MKDLKDIINRMLKDKKSETIAAIESKQGGVNSEVYKLTTDKKKEYFAKRYIVKKEDGRNKMKTEYYGTSFIWENGIRNIPEPVCYSEKDRVAVYSYLHGRKISSDKISSADVNAAADFYKKLHMLVKAKGSDEQPIASEACFSIDAYLKCVEERIKRLKRTKGTDVCVSDMHKYLDDELIPFVEEVRKHIFKNLKDTARELIRDERTLSQSDVGFHNIIKSQKGELFFIDFEYYGWDDPAKLISDFYLSPDSQLPAKYRKEFFSKMNQVYGKEHVSLKRLPYVYLVLAVKWCLIMLNCYLHEADKNVCVDQLEKAALKLNEAKKEFSEKLFPISLN
ncbi:phosphotransferase [Candidatus Margulisiibacteriota bacterium]